MDRDFGDWCVSFVYNPETGKWGWDMEPGMMWAREVSDIASNANYDLLSDAVSDAWNWYLVNKDEKD